MSGVLAIMEADAVQPHVRLVREDIGLAYMLARVLGVEAATSSPRAVCRSTQPSPNDGPRRGKWGQRGTCACVCFPPPTTRA